jgi:hypothetical protein
VTEKDKENRRDKDKEREEWPIISKYTAEDAERDGVFVYVGDAAGEKVYFTSTLFSDGYEDFQKRVDMVNRGLGLLSQRDLEDTPYMQLRVIEKDKIWVVRTGEGITYMRPSDY